VPAGPMNGRTAAPADQILRAVRSMR
jgi:hypothetical protein